VQCYAVVPAAGVGRRMASAIPKQYLPLLGKTVMEHTVQALLSQPQLQKIVVTVAADDQRWQSLALLKDERISVVIGGDQRSDSVLRGLQALQAFGIRADDWVLVHDVARPCIRRQDIERLIVQLSAEAVGGILAIPVSDTVKNVAADNNIEATLDRSQLWLAQTPQMFRFAGLQRSLTSAQQAGNEITDEASAMELAGFIPKVVLGSAGNIKITQPEDLLLAAYYLQQES
jgi:2-C-methyl-D-erythritol 4-phosphate cytidylyltransferase